MSHITSTEVALSNYALYSMSASIARYSIPVNINSRLDMIITVMGTNYSLGTTDRRFAQIYIGRRYNGAYTITEKFGSGSRFHGTLSNFNTAGVGVLLEQTSANSFIFQIHNPYSHGPTSGFSCTIEGWGFSRPTTVETYTGGNYTANPF